MTYRADIDGLRALAVTLVVLYHLGVPGFGGGYVGVDVFFVVSGYLIGGVVLGELADGSFRAATFYQRRMRRLFPAFFVVAALTTLVATALYLPLDLRRLGQSLAAATLYGSNVLFWNRAGYFEPDAHLDPLLHTWSLAVEEQFYLVFPALAWAVHRWRPAAFRPVIGALTVLSLGLAALELGPHPRAVFYLYPFRAWEMFLGVALVAGRSTARAAWRRDLEAGAGLLAVLGSGLLYTTATPFPGLAALPPCLGTALLLGAGEGGVGRVGAALAAAWPVRLGQLSYSTYLWHWPLIVLVTYATGGEPDGVAKAGLLVAIHALAWASWRFVETPFRTGRFPALRRPGPVFATVGALSAVCVAVGAGLHLAQGLPGRLDPSTLRMAEVAREPFADMDPCATSDDPLLRDVQHCVIGTPGDRYVLVWGDSHARAHQPAVAAALGEAGLGGVVVWQNACPPVEGLVEADRGDGGPGSADCVARNARVLDLVRRDRERLAAVVLVGRWAYYAQGGGTGLDAFSTIRVRTEGPARPQAEAFLDALGATIADLRGQGLRVVLVEQPPEFPRYTARSYAVALWTGRSADVLRRITTVDVAEVRARQAPVLAATARWAGEGLEVVSTHGALCAGDVCDLMRGDVPAYYDTSHVTGTTSRALAPSFRAIVGDVVPPAGPTAEVAR